MSESKTQHDEDRYFWENRLLELSFSIVHGKASYEWLTGDDFQNYLSAWYDLKSYYEKYNDTVVGAEVIMLMIGTVRWLRNIAYDPALEEDVRMAALEQLEALETTVELTMWEAVSNIKR